jgi:hypothetical protein
LRPSGSPHPPLRRHRRPNSLASICSRALDTAADRKPQEPAERW